MSVVKEAEASGPRCSSFLTTTTVNMYVVDGVRGDKTEELVVVTTQPCSLKLVKIPAGDVHSTTPE